MALLYVDVLLVWQGLMVILGAEELNAKASFGHECLRELLMRFRCFPLIAHTPQHMDDCLEMIQLLTVLANMTFTMSMGSEVNHASNWVDKLDVAGPPETWDHLKSVIRRDPDHFKSSIDIARTELKGLKETCTSQVPNVQELISRVEILLDDIHAGFTALTQPQ